MRARAGTAPEVVGAAAAVRVAAVHAVAAKSYQNHPKVREKHLKITENQSKTGRKYVPEALRSAGKRSDMIWDRF